MSNTTVERAIKVVLERFNSLKSTCGCSHTETLTTLRELIMLYMRLKSHSTVVRMLLETTVEIIEKEKHSKTLHEAAKAMGSIYITCGLVNQGHEMIQEMRLQIITGSASVRADLVYSLLRNAITQKKFAAKILQTFKASDTKLLFIFSQNSQHPFRKPDCHQG